MKITQGIALAAAAAMSLATLAACGSDTAQDAETPDSLSFWYYEEDDAGQTQAWRRAAEAFEKETGVEIKFERKSFTQIAQNGSQFLNSDEAPDLMESSRGSCGCGPHVRQAQTFAHAVSVPDRPAAASERHSGHAFDVRGIPG